MSEGRYIKEPGPVVIAGLGNELLSDDGVGVHAVRALQQDPPPGTIPVEVGTAVLDALHLFDEAGLVIALDAMQAGGAPGSIYSLDGDDLDGAVPVSMHELSLAGAMRMLRRTTPPPVLVLGVEPERLSLGLDLSDSVRAAVPRLVALVREKVAQCTT